MKVLVVGGGGREHALCWKISKSPLVTSVYCAPGNAGMVRLAECVPITATDIDKLIAFARDESIDLTVVGPEDPLSQGIVDRFEDAGMRICGASRKAARIESSKSFAKAVMEKYGIPTATGQTFTRFAQAQAYVKKMGAPLVVKALGEQIQKLRAERLCIVLAEQNAKFGMEMSGRCYVIDKGAIRYSGTIDELRQQPDLMHAYLAV